LKPKIHNLSLQGITGILFGFFAIGYIFLIHSLISQYTSASTGISLLPISFFEVLISVITLVFILISYLIIVLVNKYRRKKVNLKRWEINAKRIIGIYLIHLFIGSVLLYFLIKLGLIKFIIPFSLILYGIASIIANKYTSGISFFLGVSFLISGILAIFYPNIMFYLWGFSFGFCHIIYGIHYYIKKK